jgi:hypothetical protein
VALTGIGTAQYLPEKGNFSFEENDAEPYNAIGDDCQIEDVKDIGSAQIIGKIAHYLNSWRQQ